MLVGKPMVDFLFVLIELSSLYVAVPDLWGEMCIALLFSHGGRPLCSQFLPAQGRSPSTVLGTRKLETLGYPTVKTASLCVPSFWHNVTDRQRDRQTDGRIAYLLTYLDMVLQTASSKFCVFCRLKPFYTNTALSDFEVTSTIVTFLWLHYHTLALLSEVHSC